MPQKHKKTIFQFLKESVFLVKSLPSGLGLTNKKITNKNNKNSLAQGWAKLQVPHDPEQKPFEVTLRDVEATFRRRQLQTIQVCK